MNNVGVDIVGLVLQRWRIVAACLILSTGASIAYLLVAPKWYSATLAVVPSERAGQSAAMSLAARLPVALDPFETDVQRIDAVLRSGSVTEEIIQKFKLDARYGSDYREQTRQMLWEHCSTKVDRKSSVVTLTCEDKDPKVAMEIANAFGEVGNRVFGRISSSSAREERRFLEAQLAKTRQEVEQASEKLREFQKTHKLVDLPEQSKAVISAMASIKGELISKQLELSYLTSFSSKTEASVVQLQRQIAIMQAKLDQLEAQSGAGSAAGAGSGSAQNEFFPAAMTVPDRRYELEQLLRQQKIAETVFFLMTERFENAKINEARDTSTFQILDYPTLPTQKSRPRAKKVVMTGVAAGIGISAVWLLVPVWWRRRTRAGIEHGQSHHA